MFNTIVWATDGSEAADRALPFVKSLAGESSASIIVVHAVETFVSGYSAGLPVYGDTEEIKAKITRQVDEMRAEGVAVDTTILHVGSMRPAELIADAAEKAKADVIVVGSRGHSALAGLLLGSVTQRLLHIAPCPVFVVPSPSREAGDAVAAAEHATA